MTVDILVPSFPVSKVKNIRKIGHQEIQAIDIMNQYSFSVDINDRVSQIDEGILLIMPDYVEPKDQKLVFTEDTIIPSKYHSIVRTEKN